MRRFRAAPALIVLATLAAGCMQPEEAQPPDMSGTMEGMGATTTVLAEARVGALPAGPLAWSAFAFEDGADLEAPAPGFVSQPQGAEARAVAAGERVRAEGAVWLVLLTEPDAPAPPGAREVFRSRALEGLPEGEARLRFVRVDLMAGGQTTRHAHPGPEYVVVTHGEIVHESAVTPATRLGPGDDHQLPADTAVQKRAGEADAAFLSLFVTDPARPFVEAR